MTHIWTFSPSSKPYLQRCLAAASLQETDNEWLRMFGRKNTKVLNKPEEPKEKTTAEIIEIAPSPEEQASQKISDSIVKKTVTYENFFESVENEIKLDFISEECSKNPDLISEMAQRLSENTVEKLFNHIFTENNIENSFLTAIFHQFLPSYLKHHCTLFSIDILSITNEKYPELFQKLLKMLLEDTEIPNQVLNNYVSTLNEEKSTKFMENLLKIEMSAESFKHNILMIYTAYKDCTKTESIQKYIQTHLIQYSKSCASERNYGRLFLTFLQTEKLLEHRVNVQQLEECLDLHRSPFKRPCATLLKEFLDNS